MDTQYLEALRDYLFEFVSENKQQKFASIIQNRSKHITVVLEDIFQSHNASAVLRSCDLFGVQDVHIIENQNKYHVNPDVALGSSKWLNLQYYSKSENNTIDCFNQLRSQGYKIVATTPHKDDCLLEELPLDQKVALVFGTELHGLSDEAMQNADAFVKIPMYGFTESFNISVSAAIILFYLTEKMRKMEISWSLSETEKLTTMIEWAKQVIHKSDLIVEDFDKKYNKNYKKKS